MAVIQSAIVRSSRMWSARGNRIVKPRWYSSELTISAAFTFRMKELCKRQQ